jgi:hypothetical protein
MTTKQKRDSARLVMNCAQVKLNVLLKGIGQCLIDCASCRYYEEEIKNLLVLVNTDLTEAVFNSEKAYNNYKPFMMMRRRRISRKVKK